MLSGGVVIAMKKITNYCPASILPILLSFKQQLNSYLSLRV